MRVDRWTSLAASLFIELAAGSLYGYGSYSEHFKDSYGFSQSTVNLISSIGQVGLYVAIFGGMFYDAFGGTATTWLGVLLTVAGYSLAYIATLDIGIPCTTTTMCLFFLLAWHGSGYFDTASISTSLKNFPQSKGAVLGLNKSFFGLSGSVIAQVSVSLFSSHNTSGGGGMPILAFIAGLVLVLGLCSAPLIQLDAAGRFEPVGTQGWARLAAGYVVVLVLSLYLAILSVLRTMKLLDPNSAATAYGTTGGMMVLILLLGLVGARRPRAGKSSAVRATREAPLLAASVLDPSLASPSEATNCSAQPSGPPAAGAPSVHCNCTAPAALRTLDFYLLWLAMAAGTGPGLMFLSNVAQVAQARAGAFTDDSHTSCHTKAFYHTLGATFVVVVGVSNCVGRIVSGYISDRVKQLSRPMWFGTFLLLMAAAMLLLALVPGVPVLYAGCILGFVAYGAYWSLMPIIASELFGEAHIGTIYTLYGLAPAAASFAVTIGVASNVYAAHTPPHAPPLCKTTIGMADGKCFGQECYQWTFLICAALCLGGAALIFTLARRMRTFYHESRLAGAVLVNE